MTRASFVAIRRVMLAVLACCMCFTSWAAVRVTSEVRGSGQQAGITWLWLGIHNPTSKPVKCDLELIGYNDGGGRSKATMDIAPILPGTTRNVNLAVPVIQSYSGVVSDNDGSVEHFSMPGGYGWDRYIGFLHVTDQAKFLSDAEMDEFNYRVLPDNSTTRYGGMMGTGTATTTPTLSPGDRVLTQASPDLLPENWLCYVPLYNVIMDEQAERRLTPSQKQALETWVSLGGTLTVYGGDSKTTEGLNAGTLVKVTENPLLDPAFIPRPSGNSFPAKDKLTALSMPYTEKRAGGRNGAFLLATLFLIIAGPVNFFYFSRRGQIRKLIVSLPLISLAFCSLIGIYFVFTQGFQRKGGSISVTTLDESSNRAVTYSRHSLLSGLYPLNGFRFSRETFMNPVGTREGPGAHFDLTNDVRLRDGLFQPGIPFDYATVTPHTTKERMIYQPSLPALQNGFELPVRSVVVLENGHFWRGGGGTAGAQIRLNPLDAAEIPKAPYGKDAARNTAHQLVTLLGSPILSTEELAVVTTMATDFATGEISTSSTLYAAILDGVPKSVNSGIEISDGKNLHLLIGKVDQRRSIAP